MTDHYDEMRVSPDPSQAEALRQHLHERMADHVDPDELVAMKEINVSLNTPTSETRNRRRLVLTAAAAVIAVIGVTGIVFATNNASSDDDQPQPLSEATTVASTTTAAPTTTVAPTLETVRFPVTSAAIPVTFTVPDDWTIAEGWSAYTGGFGAAAGGLTGVVFDEISNVYTDGCQWKLFDPPVGPTVDDLVAAWANVPELNPTAPVDITVDGYAGKQIELTVPDYTGCNGGNKFGLYQIPSDQTPEEPGFWAQGPNEHNQVWVLDVDGTRLVDRRRDPTRPHRPKTGLPSSN